MHRRDSGPFLPTFGANVEKSERSGGAPTPMTGESLKKKPLLYNFRRAGTRFPRRGHPAGVGPPAVIYGAARATEGREDQGLRLPSPRARQGERPPGHAPRRPARSPARRGSDRRRNLPSQETGSGRGLHRGRGRGADSTATVRATPEAGGPPLALSPRVNQTTAEARRSIGLTPQRRPGGAGQPGFAAGTRGAPGRPRPAPLPPGSVHTP